MGISKNIVIGFFVLATAKCQENDNFQKQGYRTSKIPLGLVGAQAMLEEGIDRVTQQLDDLRTREDSLAADIDRVLRVLVIGLSILIIGSFVYLVYSYRKLVGSKIRIKLLCRSGKADGTSGVSSSIVGMGPDKVDTPGSTNPSLANVNIQGKGVVKGIKSPSVEQFCYVCCNGSKHTNLVQCSSLKKFIGLHISHRSLCTTCLGTSVWDASRCVHAGQRNWQVRYCKVGKVANLLCKCKSHNVEQRWWAINHNPQIGFGNYKRLGSELPMSDVRVIRGSAQDTLFGGLMPDSRAAEMRSEQEVRHIKRPGYSH